MLEPDLSGWCGYDSVVVPEEKRPVVLRVMHHVPCYHVVVILNRGNGYASSDLGTFFWKRWEGAGTHWVYLDQLAKVEDQPNTEEADNG